MVAHLWMGDVGRLESKSQRSDEPLVLWRLPRKPLPHVRYLGYHAFPRLLYNGDDTKAHVVTVTMGEC